MATKLNSGQKYLLGLVKTGADSDGWAILSAQVTRLFSDMPKELVEIKPFGDKGRGRMKLTAAGANLLEAMKWL